MTKIDLTEKNIGKHKPGTWVALAEDNKVVAEGQNFNEVYDKAVAKGIKEPFVASTTVTRCTMIL